jgi:hypothetical protein
MNEEESDNDMRTGDQIKILTDILRKQLDLGKQVESRANVVIGLSGAAIALAITKVSKYGPWIPVLVAAATISILLSLLAMKPPKFLSRHGQTESLFYHTSIASQSEQEYAKNIAATVKDLDLVIKQYTIEIHNFVTYSLKYKKLFAHTAVMVLIFGMIAAVAVRFVYS